LACAAVSFVIASAATQSVSASAAVSFVIASAAKQSVSASAAVYFVIASGAKQSFVGSLFELTLETQIASFGLAEVPCQTSLAMTLSPVIANGVKQSVAFAT